MATYLFGLRTCGLLAGEGLAGTVVRMAYGGMTVDRDGKPVPQYMLMRVRVGWAGKRSACSCGCIWDRRCASLCSWMH